MNDIWIIAGDKIEMNVITLKQKLLRSELALGSWITLAHPAIAEIMSKAGFDWLAVDMEHSVITIREAEELIRVIELCGVTPLVRLTSNDRDQIKRVMDAGAKGIIVPMVNNQEEAEKAIAAVYYPNKGNRGIGLARAQGYGAKFTDYLDWQKDGPIVITQIEHVRAVENIESILSVNGVDGYFLGPYDLSGSMGISGQFDHPEFLGAVNKVKTVAKKMNKPGGIHIIEPDLNELTARINEGFKFIAYSLDIRMLDVASRLACKQVKAIIE